MTETVLAQIRQIAAEVFGVGEERLSPESSPQTIENWDSIQHLNFILALEARFATEFSAEEMEGVRSIADAVALIEKKQAA